MVGQNNLGLPVLMMADLFSAGLNAILSFSCTRLFLLSSSLLTAFPLSLSLSFSFSLSFSLSLSLSVYFPLLAYCVSSHNMRLRERRMKTANTLLMQDWLYYRPVLTGAV